MLWNKILFTSDVMDKDTICGRFYGIWPKILLMILLAEKLFLTDFWTKILFVAILWSKIQFYTIVTHFMGSDTICESFNRLRYYFWRFFWG